MELKYTERLAKTLFIAGIIFICFIICRTFSKVLLYLLISAVIALISKPLILLLKKIKIRKKSAPDWLLALISIVLIVGLLSGIFCAFIPVFDKVFTEVALLSENETLLESSDYFAKLNAFLINTFHFNDTFKVETLIIDKAEMALNIDILGGLVNTLASGLTNIGIGVFSVIFISFFFIKDEDIIRNMIRNYFPEKIKAKAAEAAESLDVLLSRYFLGLLIEMVCVGLIDFTGLCLFAKIDVESALGIGFLAGLLNIIPYLGPLLGGIIGTILALVVKFCAVGSLTMGGVGLSTYVIILIAIFATAQLVDNFVLQPVIYSTSIKASPLEIFIVLLMAGTIGGIIGMLVAIPAYTVIRVLAGTFFSHLKPIRRLLKLDENQA
ncbi:MAG: AI-2E family transporter [Bacteroidales bacterium]|nr:AI-2E family transporter [Bacteroidales bacterium]